MRCYVIGGNWKMQVLTVNESVRIAQEIARGLSSISTVEVFISPSFNALYPVSQAIKETHLNLAGQNMYTHDKGAFTGQISALSLVDAHCRYVLLGHSEPRRIFGEQDELIRQKLLKALEHKILPVLCIGETARERELGQATEVLHKQLAGSLKGLTTNQMMQIVIAYEPVWAINNKFLNPDTEIRPATPVEAKEAHGITREWLRNEFGAPLAEEISIIYGGSMNANNAKELLSLDDIDGGLIGGASLSADKFLPIIQFAAKLSGEESADYQWDSNTLRFKD
ncbi:MAG: triose-phosphate isomerase [Candidatus Hodarchaeales archaeon]